MNLTRELAVASRLAREAGDLLMRLRGVAEVSHKHDGEIVTAADLESDRLIRAGLVEAFPDDALVSEEAPTGGDRLAEGGRAWIVDPIDATRDYASGGDEFSVSIGLAVGGEAVLGAVCAPARGELIVGAIGAGVSLNGAPARVSAAPAVQGARLTVSRSEWRDGDLGRRLPFPVGPVSSAAYKLARVGAGLDDGTFSTHARRDWDICAGVALVLAGGGRVTLLDGSAMRFDRAELLQPMGLVAAGPALHRQLRTVLAPILAKPLAGGATTR
ncbi:MAG: inositol monophosphatase family protein [Anaeromyxobacteraceae bacterium]